MTAKRIRCTCGRIYDPVKHAKCPDCGAATVVATAAEPPPVSIPTKTPVAEQPPKLPTSVQSPIPLDRRTMMMIGGGLLLLIVIVLAVGHPGGKKESGKDRGSSTPPGPSPSATTRGNTTVIVIPPHGGSTESSDLSAMIANAAAGATISVPPGLYRGGVIVPRAVRIVGDSRTGGQVVIQSEGKECLSVRSRGVAVQNVQFMCNGIGELPAISVADGADLVMDGCKVQSGTRLAVALSGNAAIKAIGSTISATNGAAIRLDKQARADLTQCSFPDTRLGIDASNGATAELHSCAFERIGGNEARGAIMVLRGDKTAITADDCHFNQNSVGIGVSEGALLTITNSFFKDNGASAPRGSGASGLISIRDRSRGTLTAVSFENNSEGVAVRESGTVEMEKCQFTGCGARQSTRDVVAAYLPISAADERSTATVRNCVFINSTTYAVNVSSGATLNLEDSQISGSRSAALVAGDRNHTTPAHVEVKRSHFIGNGTGIGVFAGSTANVEDSECKENQDGIIVLDRPSQLKLTKTAVVSNKDFGLYVHGNAQVTATDCDIQNNSKGAQSGTSRKSSERASLTLQNCRFGGNRTFGAGACTQSELILSGCTFDGTDKTNIYKEHGAVVQTSELTEASPSPGSSAEPTAEEKAEGGQVRRRSTPSPNKRRRDDDIYRLFRRFRP